MKKFVAVLSAAAMLATLAACGSTAATTSTAASSADTAASTSSEAAAADDTAKSYKIAVVQQLDHASLDEIRTAVEAELDAKAAEKGITIEYKDFNGQNDATTLNQIGTQVVSDGYDAVVPIATLAAQCMANACAEDQIPVVYAAISDPAAADLTGLDYVTGTSDALNTQFILDMMLAINPDVKTVGLLYSNSEANSTTPIAEAKAYLDEKGIAYVEGTGNTNDEIMSAAANMVGKADAVFTPTDNVVMAAAAAVSETLTEAGIPFYTGADSFVTAGAFATCGVNYTELGTYTADMVLDILESGNVPEYHVMDGGIITVNTETAAALGIDYAAFSNMVGVGSMIPSCMEICKGLKDDGYDPTFVNARFVKPLDVDLLDELAKDHSLFVTVEENVKSGGYGEHVSAYMEACHPEIRVLSAAVWDRFVPQGNVESLRSRIGLGVEDIRQAIEDSEELREQ